MERILIVSLDKLFDPPFMYVAEFLGENELLNCSDYTSEHFWKSTKWLDDAEFSCSLYGKISYTLFTKLQKIMPLGYKNCHVLNRMRLLYIPHGIRAEGLIETPEEPLTDDTFMLAFVFITKATVQMKDVVSYINPGDLFMFPMNEKIIIDNEQSSTCGDIKAYGICIVCTKEQRLRTQK